MKRVMIWFALPAVLAPVFLSLTAAKSIAQCTPHWEPLGIPDPSGSVSAIIWHDDGAGPSLFVAGAFGSAASKPALNITRISNGFGHALGEGLSGRINALATFNDGTGAKLYAGGSFTKSGSTELLRLACWDGSSWSSVGGGANGTIYALAAHNDGFGNALFVGGQFTSAGGMPVSSIARWNGSTWNSLSGGLSGAASPTVKALLSRSDLPTPVLYAAGRIISANGTPATPVVQWNGANWSNVGNDATGNTTLSVTALAMYDPGTGPSLFRGAVSGTAYLSVNGWVSAPLVANVTSMQVVHDSSPRGNLYIGTSSSGNGLVKFDGSTLTATGLALGGVCASLQEIPGGRLAVGGRFSDANGIPANNLAILDPALGFQSAGDIENGGQFSAYAQSPDATSRYIGGYLSHGFWKIGASSLVPLTITGFSGNLSGFANDMELFSPGGIPTLVSAGYFMTPRFGSSLVWQNDVNGTFPAEYNNAAAVTNSSSDLLRSRHGGVSSLLMSGRFRITTDVTYHGVLRYSDSRVISIATDPHPNFWGGKMAIRSTPEGEYLYIWDANSNTTTLPPVYMLQPGNTTWTPIPGVLMFQNREAIRDELCLCWFDDGGRDGGHLYIGGRFDTVNGLPAHGLARVVNGEIEPLAAGVDGADSIIHDLVVFDDGSGPALYASGAFRSIAGVPANNVARLQNGIWSAVGGGVTVATSLDLYTPPVYRMVPISDQSGDWLYAVGSFVVADGQYSPKLARYGRCRPCPADFNNDGTSDFFDYLDFVQAFSSNESAADFNHDAIIDFFDYLDFVAVFSIGC